jgi:hypothetical protein
MESYYDGSTSSLGSLVIISIDPLPSAPPTLSESEQVNGPVSSVVVEECAADSFLPAAASLQQPPTSKTTAAGKKKQKSKKSGAQEKDTEKVPKPFGPKKEKAAWPCRLCDRRLPCRSKLLSHYSTKHSYVRLRQQFGLKPADKQCPLCPKVFKRSSTILEHMGRVHADMRDYVPQEHWSLLEEGSSSAPPSADQAGDVSPKEDVGDVSEIGDVNQMGDVSRMEDLADTVSCSSAEEGEELGVTPGWDNLDVFDFLLDGVSEGCLSEVEVKYFMLIGESFVFNLYQE